MSFATHFRLRFVWVLLLGASIGVFTDSARAQLAGKIIAIQGTVEVSQPDWAPAVVNQELPAGSLVRTGARSRATVVLVDETQLKLGPNSQMELKAVRPGSGLLQRLANVSNQTDQSLINLNSGKAWIRNDKKPASVKVATPAVTAAVRGTEFVVEVAGDGETTTSVLEGRIDFSNEQGALSLAKGEQGHARVGQAPTKTILLNPDDAVQWSFNYTAAVSPRDYPFQAPGESVAPSGDPLDQAEALFDAGRYADSLQVLETSQGARKALLAGWNLLAMNRLAEAVAAFQEAGDAPRARLGLSLALFRLNELGRAFSLVEEATTTPLKVQKATLLLISGEVREALSLLDGVPEDDPYRALVKALRATIELTLNDKEGALRLARNAVEDNPNSPSAYLSLSRVEQSFFDLAAATRSAEKALQLDGQFLDGKVQYATLLFGSGRAAQAERVAREALATAPEEPAVQSLMGFILLGQAKTDEAVVHFEKAVRLDSERADPHLGLGIAWLRQGKRREAVAETLTAAILEPRVSLYKSYLAKGFFELRDFEQALAALDTAQELDPRDPTPHLYRGIFQNDLNRPGQAVADLQESIRLNDNRAVYRSRFVLDEDRATRNVQLARSYNRLGLSEWGNLEATLSALSDPTSSSSHLFLANTFINLRGRTAAAGSESLIARLLLPVNSNSFNSFNDYTTLYERPRLNWTAEGSYGSFDAAAANLIASGGTNRIGFSSTFSFDRTAGFRPVNDDSRSYTTFNIFKFALTPSSDLMVTYSHDQARLGDVGQVLVNDSNDPDRRFFTGLHRAEVGYHHRFSPGSELLVYFSGRSFRLVDDNANAVSSVALQRFCRTAGREIPPCSFQDIRNSLKLPSFTLQASHIFKVADFTFRYGFDIYEGRARNRRTQHYIPSLFSPFEEGDDPFEQDPNIQRQDVKSRTVFVQSDYAIHPRLTLTGGLNYDWANDDNVFIGESDIVGVDAQGGPIFGVNHSISRWSPYGAALFSPIDGTVIRVAASRVLQPLVSALGGAFVRERLTPAHVDGFVFNLNEPELSRSKVYNAGIDQRLLGRGFLRVTGFWRDRDIPTAETLPLTGFLSPTTFQGNFYGAGAVWSYYFTEGLSFTAQYELTRAEDLSATRRNHDARIAAYYINSRGLFFQVQESYLKQNGIFANQPTATKAYTTDASVSYEFPEKRGLVAFRATNIFDRRYSFLVDPLELDPRVPRRQLEVVLRFNF